MGKQSYLSLLILSVIFSQGIAAVKNESIEEPDRHIRIKRVIDKTLRGHVTNQLVRTPYVVNILKNGVSHCGGSILVSNIILTAAHCIRNTMPPSRFTILSGSSMRNNGTPHNIVRQIFHPLYDLALVKIFPPINIVDGVNKNIDLFTDELHPEVFRSGYGTFSGWGCTSLGRNGRTPIYPEELMVTRLPIISEQECETSYGGEVIITNRQICTLDRTKRRATCIGDEGGPLVYNDRLLGTMSYLRGVHVGENADVFVNLNHPEHIQWINEMINILRH